MKEREKNEERLERAIRAFTEKLKWRPNYESWVEGRIWQEHRQKPALWNLNHFVPSLKNSIIVEIGSGMGGLLVCLQREGLKALGVEYNPEYCNITKYRAERYGISPSVTAARAEQLPLRDRCVDVVLCYEVIEHSVRSRRHAERDQENPQGGRKGLSQHPQSLVALRLSLPSMGDRISAALSCGPFRRLDRKSQAFHRYRTSEAIGNALLFLERLGLFVS